MIKLYLYNIIMLLLFIYMDYIILHFINMKIYEVEVVLYILGLYSLFWLGLSLWAMVVSTIVLTLFTFASLLGIILGSLLDNISLYGHLYGRLCFSTLGFGSYSLPITLSILPFIVMIVSTMGILGIGLSSPVLLYLLYFYVLVVCSKEIDLLVIKLGLLFIISIGLYSIYVGYLRPYPILSLINSLVIKLGLCLPSKDIGLLGIIHDIILLLNKIGLIIINVILVYIIISSIVLSSLSAILAHILGSVLPISLNKPNTHRAIRILIIIPPTKPNTLRAIGICTIPYIIIGIMVHLGKYLLFIVLKIQ